MPEPKNKKREFMEIARLTSVGFGLVISVLIGWFIGKLIDDRFRTAPVFMLVFLLIGTASGIINVFRTLGKHRD
jgi:ATP synthase protein I